MEVGRVAIGLGFFGMAAYGFFSFTAVEQTITLSGAELQPMGDAYILTGQIYNTSGQPDRLTAIGSDAAGRAALVGERIVVPGGDKPFLAMDGAHGVLLALHEEASEGKLLPVTLWFEDAGRIATRARVTGPMQMQHNLRHDVPEDAPQPSVSINLGPDGSGWTVSIQTENFTFSEAAADGPHQPGVGHGHLYLNGLKLGRVYGPQARIGTLLPGSYTVEVTLTTNDHRSYATGGQPVSATQILVVE